MQGIICCAGKVQGRAKSQKYIKFTKAAFLKNSIQVVSDTASFLGCEAASLS